MVSLCDTVRWKEEGGVRLPHAGAPARWELQQADGTFELAQGSWSLTPAQPPWYGLWWGFFCWSSGIKWVKEELFSFTPRSCHLLIFTLNYRLRFSFSPAVDAIRAAAVFCLDRKQLSIPVVQHVDFAFARSNIFLALSLLVQTLAVFYPQVKFTSWHQVEPGTSATSACNRNYI